MKYLEAIEIANRLKFQLLPHFDRIEIAGALRRKKTEVHDIELVGIVKDYEMGLFAKGLGLWLAGVDILKGQPGPDCRYLQIRLPEKINLDLFFAKPETWGYIFLLRSGPSLFSKDFVVKLRNRGYHGEDGAIKNSIGQIIPTADEVDAFRLAGFPFIKPEHRI
jgi:DNA polymerase/3'-5' exonuclease PolX